VALMISGTATRRQQNACLPGQATFYHSALQHNCLAVGTLERFGGLMQNGDEPCPSRRSE